MKGGGLAVDKKIIIFSGGSDEASGEQPELLSDAADTLGGVPVQKIKQNLDEFVSALDEIIPKAEDTETGFRLKSFDVSVGINGKGQVGFLGTGTEVGATATLTLKFER